MTFIDGLQMEELVYLHNVDHLLCQISVIAESVSPFIVVSWLIDICCCVWISLFHYL